MGVAARRLPAVRLPFQPRHRGARRAEVRMPFTTRGSIIRDGASNGSSWGRTVERRASATSALQHVRNRAPAATSQRIEPAVRRGTRRDECLNSSTTCGDSAPNVPQSSGLSIIVVPSPAAPQLLEHVRGQRSRWRPRFRGPGASWRARRRPFRQAGMRGVRLRTPPDRSATESA